MHEPSSIVKNSNPWEIDNKTLKGMLEKGQISQREYNAMRAVRNEMRKLNRPKVERPKNKAEQLVNKSIEASFAKHPLYSQDGKGGEADILVKYFNPYGQGRWYVLEASPIGNGDYDMFGIVEMNGEREYGYFRLSELQNYKFKMGGREVGGIERDMYFGKKKVKDIKNSY